MKYLAVFSSLSSKKAGSKLLGVLLGLILPLLISCSATKPSKVSAASDQAALGASALKDDPETEPKAPLKAETTGLPHEAKPGEPRPGKSIQEPTALEQQIPHEEAQSEQPPPVELSLPTGTTILQVGDSFAGALGIPLGKLFEEAGIRFILKNKDASYLTDLAWDGELKRALNADKPDLVLITVGANELGIAAPEKRASTIAKILDTLGDTPCLWVGIPLWKGPQNGLMTVIEDNSGKCLYWDTNKLIDVKKMPRIQDGIHPTTSARKAWAQQVFAWLQVHRQPEGRNVWQLTP